MRAIVTTGQNDLHIIEIPLPAIGPGQVLVRIEAAAVNPVDIGTRLGVFHQAGMIAAGATTGLGWDLAGTVDSIGPDVQDIRVGDRVAAVLSGFDIPPRAYADYALVPAAAVARIPDGLIAIDAATIPLNALTAAQALDLITPESANNLLITGAAGAVGGFAVTLARKNGWRTTAHARQADTEFLRQAGADEIITDLPDAPRFDTVLDAAGLGNPALDTVRDGGSYVGVTPGATPPEQRGITVTAVSSHHDGARLAELLKMAATGDLAVRVAGTLPLADAAQAQANVQKGGQRGRWVLLP
ncbi:NADPH:quinone reductase-like Zn-dependent oxidoreductase [Nakamurella sp. UYEF19]|uniref:NADP-dependent oxidoreductase n=1 Tax=Nakamurella sp. UYEF19 TaxID=1756392 RepID=UPI0033976D7E